MSKAATATSPNESAGVEKLEPVRDLLNAVGLNPSDPTIWRWVKKGRGGKLLQVVRSARLLSRRSWVDAFIREGLTENAPAVPVAASPRQLEARHKRALTALNE